MPVGEHGTNLGCVKVEAEGIDVYILQTAWIGVCDTIDSFSARTYIYDTILGNTNTGEQNLLAAKGAHVNIGQGCLTITP